MSQEPGYYQSERFRKRLKRRHAGDRWLVWSGAGAVVTGLALLAILIVSIVLHGYQAFLQTEIRLAVDLREEVIDPEGDRSEQAIRDASYRRLIGEALQATLGEPEDRSLIREQIGLMGEGAAEVLRARVLADPGIIGTTREVWLPAASQIDQLVKGKVDRDLPPEQRQVSDRQLDWIDRLRDDGSLELSFNDRFFTSTDSQSPASAGILGALVGSALTLVITLVVSFPVAIAAAIYLEEFAPKTWWTRIIEVNINNLAAVPSIVFGLLGLALFLNFFGMPRSAPIVGGLVLALMTLPIIIVSARSALKAVPSSVREAALMVGASRELTVFRQVLPVAMPGMLTGTIIGIAQALGETAPLLLIGMIAFVNAVPGGFTDPATVLPAQIYIWASNAETAYAERASGGILVLLAMMFLLNGTAIFLRQRLQRRGQ